MELEPRCTKRNSAIDTPLRGTVISMFVANLRLMLCEHNAHLRADRILDPAYENTAYEPDDLARALLTRQYVLRRRAASALVHRPRAGHDTPWDKLGGFGGRNTLFVIDGASRPEPHAFRPRGKEHVD